MADATCVNYWRGTALVNGAGAGLVEIMLDPPELVRLGLTLYLNEACQPGRG